LPFTNSNIHYVCCLCLLIYHHLFLEVSLYHITDFVLFQFHGAGSFYIRVTTFCCGDFSQWSIYANWPVKHCSAFFSLHYVMTPGQIPPAVLAINLWFLLYVIIVSLHDLHHIVNASKFIRLLESCTILPLNYRYAFSIRFNQEIWYICYSVNMVLSSRWTLLLISN
jgi:hypothetical protein